MAWLYCGDFSDMWNPGRLWLTCGLLLCQMLVGMTTGMSAHVQLHPPSRTSRSAEDTAPSVDGPAFLAKYGYLPRASMDKGALLTLEEYETAIRGYQRMAALPQTGQLDEATLAEMRKPRCGLPDVMPTSSSADIDQRPGDERRRRRFALLGSKWEKKHLTYRILNYTPDLKKKEVHWALNRAFQAWSAVSQLTFNEANQQDSSADIDVSFGSLKHIDCPYPLDGPPREDGNGRELAHAFPPGDGMGGDVHFDEDEKWVYDSDEGIDLFSVALHELGHSLGMNHSKKGTAMYSTYQGYDPDFKLSDDDIAGISYLYGAKYPTSTTTTTRSTTTRSTKPTTRVTRPTTTMITRKPPPSHDTPPPHRCNTSFDAISIIRRELFAFKGKWFWRRNKNGEMNEVAEISRLWNGLPADVGAIDAVFEKPTDGQICFFSGNRYWLFEGDKLSPGFPKSGRPLTWLGLPASVKRVDAAFVWGNNRLPYIISGNMYWRLSSNGDRVEPGYPRDMNIWSDVPLPVDAAFQDFDGVTYFVRDKYLIEIDDDDMKVKDESHRKLLGTHLFLCAHAPCFGPNLLLYLAALVLVCVCCRSGH